MMAVHRTTVAVVALLLVLLPIGHSFPAYLLSESNCWTQLSTDEVMMNAAVVAADVSDDPAMHIAIVTETDTSVTLGVATTNTNTNPDYHFVMDVVVADEDGSATGDSPCTFVKGSCDHAKRIIGQAHTTVELQRPDRATACTVVAGWAAGHEAVRLTPELHLGLAVPKGKVAVAVPVVGDEVVHHESILETPGVVEKKDDPQRMLDTKHDLDGKLQKQLDEHWRKEVEQEKKTRHQKIQHIEQERQQEHQIHKNLLHYEIGFETVGISWYGYLRGALFLVVASAVFVSVSLKVSQGGEKGRRSL